MIDEYFDRLVDRWCEAVPRTMKPRMILLANSAIGWRMQLYFGTLGRNIAGLFSRVKDETQMDLTLREGSEQIDDGLARLARFLKEQVPNLEQNEYYGKYADAETRKLVALHQKSNVLFVGYYKALSLYRKLRYQKRKK